MARALGRHTFLGPAGRLEGLLHVPTASRFAAVVAHPHPLHGGTMDSKVAYRVARALEDAGGLVLRFNFRGVGASEGRHDAGRGEQDDLLAALSEVRAAGDPALPAVLAGFSFGSVVSSLVAARLDGEDPGLQGILLVGAPLAHHDFHELLSGSLRTALVHGDRDEHGPLALLLGLHERLGMRSSLRLIAGADHFFAERQEALRDAVRELATSGGLGVPPRDEAPA